MVRDIDELKQQPFHYVILDESQAIKNPNSQRYKAVRLLQAWNRLALSGTPIECKVAAAFALICISFCTTHFKKLHQLLHSFNPHLNTI